MDDFADLVHAKLGFAAHDEIRDIAAVLEPGLWPDLIGDAKALKQFIDIGRAARIDVGRTHWREQRVLEGLSHL